MSDKNRCRNFEEANRCTFYVRNEKPHLGKTKEMIMKPEIHVPTNTEKLAELAARQARSVVAVIDALASRGGAFKGEELATIGMLRNQSGEIVQLAETVLSEISAK